MIFFKDILQFPGKYRGRLNYQNPKSFYHVNVILAEVDQNPDYLSVGAITFTNPQRQYATKIHFFLKKT